LRLFFTGEQEALAVSLAKLFLEHLDDSDYFVRPDDPIEELIGWGTKPVPEIVSFLKTMEEQEVFPKEALAHVETFRELVEYVAARSHSCHPTAHNSFTNL
jgi:hypothetical protein